MTEASNIPPLPPPGWSPEPPAADVVLVASPLDRAARAAIGRRVGAAWIDIGLLGVLAASFTERVPTDVGTAGVRFELQGGGLLLVLFASVAFYFVAELLCGTSPGKWLLGLRVVGATGERPTVGAIAIRTVFRAIDGLPLFYLVGFIVMLATGSKQRVGDLVAGTRIVRSRDLASLGVGHGSTRRGVEVAVLGAVLAATIGLTVVGFTRPDPVDPDERVGAFAYEPDIVSAVDDVVPLLFVDDERVLTWLVPGVGNSEELAAFGEQIDDTLGAWSGDYTIEDHRRGPDATIDELGVQDAPVMQVRLSTSFERANSAEIVLTFTDNDGELQLLRWDVSLLD